MASISLVLLLAFALGYLLGSIPFGLVLTKIAGTDDIRQIGSGNIGATNVLRTGRKGLAAATLIGDMLKGTVAVLIGIALAGREAGLAAAVGAFVGHLFPVWLGFKGGKGIATYIGVLIGFAWPAAAIFGAVWIATAAAARYSSLASLLGCVSTPIYFFATGDRLAALVFLALSVLSFVMHRGNIQRLIAGTEGKIGQSAPKGAG